MNRGADATVDYPKTSYYRARYYDPRSGRFLNEDRLGFEGGVNFYRYAGNSPVLWIDPSGGNQCYSVTPNGMTEKPCVDPQPDMTCNYVPGGIYSCTVPMPPSPPAGPLHYHDTSLGCACNPMYLMTQAKNIRTEERNKNYREGGFAVVTTGLLEGMGHLLGEPAGAVAEIGDLVFLGQDAYEYWHRRNRADERIRDLFAPCNN